MATNFEAKLHAFRRTQDGVVVSYVVHPNDVSAELATAALGTRYMVAVAEIGDDGKPKSSAPALCSEAEKAPEDAVPPASSGAAQKERKPFGDLRLSTQAAMRCREQSFVDFLSQRDPSLPDNFDPAQTVRDICRATSRAQFDMIGYPQDAWKQIESQYQSYLTDLRYAGAKL